MIPEHLMGKCGFYCGSCPDFLNKKCLGCVQGQKKGNCFTRDCVMQKGLEFCGECMDFPCETIMTMPKTTVLDVSWLKWKAAKKR